MTPQKPNSYFAWLNKCHDSYVTPIVGLISTLLSLTLRLRDELFVGMIVLAVVGTILLLLFNAWIPHVILTSIIDGSRRHRYSRQLRILIHSLSASVLVLSWTLIIYMTSDKYGSKVLYSVRQYPKAARRLEDYCERNPLDYDAGYMLGQCYYKQHQLARYIQTIDRLLSERQIWENLSNQESVQRQFDLNMTVALLLVDHDYIEGITEPGDLAKEYARRANELDSNMPNPYWIFGFVSALDTNGKPLEGDIDSVVSSFDRSTGIIEAMRSSNDSGYQRYQLRHHLLFGRALSELGHYTEAKKELLNALGIAEKNIHLSDFKDPLFIRLGQNEFRLTEDANSCDTYWTRVRDDHYRARVSLEIAAGFSLGGRQETFEGEKTKYTNFAFAAHEKIHGRTSRSGKLSFLRGLVYFAEKKYKFASAAFEEAADKNTSEYLPYYWIAQSRLCLFHESRDNPDPGELAKARKAIQDANELHPQNTDVLCCSGRVFVAEGKIKAGLEAFNLSIESDKNNAQAYKWFALCSYRLAVEETDRDSRIRILHTALRRTIRGIIVSRSQDDASALASIGQWRARLQNALAYAYVEGKKNFTAANNGIEEALKEAPDDPYLLDTKAWLIVMEVEDPKSDLAEDVKSHYESAYLLLRKSLARFPHPDDMDELLYKPYADILYHLGHVENALGRKTEAKELLLECLDYCPGHGPALRKLESL